MLQVMTDAMARALATGEEALRGGDAAQAERLFRQLLAQYPQLAPAHEGLAAALWALGRPAEAIAAVRQSLAIRPVASATWYQLGSMLLATGQTAEAEPALRKAIEQQPRFFAALNDLGIALGLLRRPQESVEAFQKAIAINPGYVAALNNLGNALKWQGRFEESEAAFRSAVKTGPKVAEIFNNLAALLNMMGRCQEALDAYRQAIALKPSLQAAWSGYLYTLHFVPGSAPAEVFAEHRRWAENSAPAYAALIGPLANDRSPERRLRIGYVSSDFRAHSVGFFMESLLTHHDRRQVEVFCYADTSAPDAATQRLGALADQWRPITGQPDARVAQLVREDRIDILVDLHGHTLGNRLPLFAQKPAPLQVTYLGYPDTTGLPTIDYRLTDSFADPEGPEAADRYCTEKLVRLPGTFLCYTPPQAAPDVAPRTPDQPLTFGSFNALQKISTDAVDMWARILVALPDARLLLKAVGLQETSVQRHVAGLFASRGVAADRLILRGHTADFSEHLALYGQVDVALDTFPYHGTTTTCEALWMGVPVVTLAGRMHCGRVGVSLLSNMGLPELIAPTPQDYVSIAVAVAQDRALLAEHRRTLRQRMAASALMDGARFARHVDEAYRRMWRTWCAAPR